MRIPIASILVALSGVAIIAGSFGPWVTDGEYTLSGFDRESNDALVTTVLGGLVILGGLLSLAPNLLWPLGLAPLPAGLAAWVAGTAWRDIVAAPPEPLEDAPTTDQSAAWGIFVILLAAASVMVAVLFKVAGALFPGDDEESDS